MGARGVHHSDDLRSLAQTLQRVQEPAAVIPLSAGLIGQIGAGSIKLPLAVRAAHRPHDLTIGWCVIAEPQVWSTAVMPILAPSRLGSAAMVSVVSAAAFMSKS